MFDPNNNNVDHNDANNNTTIKLSLHQPIGGVQEPFSGLEHERSKYKKELECLRQQRNDENFVLLKSMNRLRMVCCEGKKATECANGERNKYRKLLAQLKKPNRVPFNCPKAEYSDVDLSGLGTAVMVAPESATDAVPKLLTSDKTVGVVPTSAAEISAHASPSTLKRKFGAETISTLSRNKKRKTGA